jgi:hypothetical protein
MLSRRTFVSLSAMAGFLLGTRSLGAPGAVAQQTSGEHYAGLLLLPNHEVPTPPFVVFHNAGKFPTYGGDGPARTVTRDMPLREARDYTGADLYELNPVPTHLEPSQLAHVIVHDSGSVTRVLVSYDAPDPRGRKSPAVTITVDPTHAVPVPVRPGRDPQRGFVPPTKWNSGLPRPGVTLPAGDTQVAFWMEESGLVTLIVNEAQAGASLWDVVASLRRV